MQICIDSSAFIPRLEGSDPSTARLVELIRSELILIIPRLIAQEVTRNIAISVNNSSVRSPKPHPIASTDFPEKQHLLVS